MAERSGEEVLLELAAFDWVVFGNSKRLHHAAELVIDVAGWCYEDVTTSCGLRVPYARIPGMFTRMRAKRCNRCCDRLGWPRGIGSPKNDDALRPLVGLPPKEAK